MPIEDINYLYDHCVKDAFMFFIDSANRDRRYYPEPNHYVVTFEEPLKLVYGLDILDATMPNVMYNIDSHNNKLCMVLLRSSEDESANRVAYNARLRTMIQEQQNNALFADNFETFKSFDTYFVDRSEWLSHPELQAYLDSEVDPQFAPASAVDVTLFILVSRFTQVPLQAQSTLPAEVAAEYAQDTQHYASFRYGGDVYFVPATHDLAALIATQKIEAFYVCQDETDKTWSVTASTNVRVPPLHGDGGYVLQKIDPSSEPVKYNLLQQKALTLEVGQYDVNTLQEEMQTQMGTFGIYVVGTDRAESSDLIKQGRVMLINSAHPFLLNMNISSIYPNIGFDRYAIDKSTDYAKGYFNDNHRLYATIYNEKAERFQLRAPGAINLLGTRYITLRCKEIEDHLSSSVTFNSYSTGIGVFKLQDIRDTTNLRFDFATFLQKPFHPIGKLSRLTLRFETPNGLLYDFKGFNHHIMISIKYFAPDMGRVFKQSALNPNYDPDYIRYITNIAHNIALDDYNEDESTSDEDDTSSD